MILSITIGIATATPLISAELNIIPWFTRVQGPTVPFVFEVVYANYTITDPDATITQNGGPKIDYEVVINVTNPSEYRNITGSINLFAAQEVHETTAKTLMEMFNIPGNSGRGIEAKGAWVDGVYYNVTCTIPWPALDENGVIIGDYMSRLESLITGWSFGDEQGNRWTNENSTFGDEQGNRWTNENSTFEEHKAIYYSQFYKWKEGVQGYEWTISDGTSTTKYIYLNIDGTWVDVTGRVTFDKEPEPDRPAYSSKGGFASKMIRFNSWYDRVFEPGESRLIIISGSVDIQPPVSENYINPVDIIQSGTIHTLIQAYTNLEVEYDINAYIESNTYLDTHTQSGKIQELVLAQVGNSYIYNTVLSDNQMFQLDRYGIEVFIVPVR
ncbi:MAG: hypothetical protein FWF66_04420 [Candidatus Bathyarchaeota archaeon]|nr:hypothetical protein [Candidatus Termiticorpusculum sp.]